MSSFNIYVWEINKFYTLKHEKKKKKKKKTVVATLNEKIFLFWFFLDKKITFYLLMNIWGPYFIRGFRLLLSCLTHTHTIKKLKFRLLIVNFNSFQELNKAT